jgi:hypothetical protein
VSGGGYGQRQGGDLTIEREDVLLELSRGERGDVLRVCFTQGTASDGKRVAWHSIREFYTDEEGTKKPGKKGITIRGRELRAVAEALTRAAAGGQPQSRLQQPPARRPAPTPLAPAAHEHDPFGGGDADPF